MSLIDESAVRRLAELARLRLDEAELAAAAAEIERLRGYIARIQAVQAAEAAPPAGVPRPGLPGREDRPQPGLSPAEALAAAPAVEAGHFAVPKLIEDSGR